MILVLGERLLLRLVSYCSKGSGFTSSGFLVDLWLLSRVLAVFCTSKLLETSLLRRHDLVFSGCSLMFYKSSLGCKLTEL